ncbi:proline-rich family protein [Striga asiatica]|uniref:Proline-rich family protein n=1 Tax=Striga asiatica TaxID=4170 RepID=A0A5A7QN48_STRAF|nr:proline-rich family protein [Striga asiatica]
MNRSFRAFEKGQMGSLRLKDNRDEDLALFREMRKREKERNDLLLQNADEFEAPLGHGTSPIFNIPSATSAPGRKTGPDNFLNSENDKNDYDWLLTPPGTPLFPSLEMEKHKTVTSQVGTPKARPTALKSRLSNSQPEPTSRSNPSRRPSSSSGPGSRPSTPTSRPTLTSTSSRPTSNKKPTATSSKPTATSSSRSAPAATSSSKPSRSSTPTTSRPTISSSRPTAAASRSSTPTRSTVPTTTTRAPPPARTTSRASTPTRRPTNGTPGPTQPKSPTVRPKIWKPSEMPGFSLDAPPNLRTSVADRPPSAARGRPGPSPGPRSSSVERVRRQSCSPARGRPANTISSRSSGRSLPVPGLSRLQAKANDNVSPVLVGTKMVERVINMRKLAPPKQDVIKNSNSPRGNLSGKSSSSSPEGFGRTLSKKSLDMAIRHMDIRRTIPGTLRPLMTNIPAASMYSVRVGPTRRTVSVSDSPVATSSNASSEVSVNNGHEVDDDVSSDKGI